MAAENKMANNQLIKINNNENKWKSIIIQSI